jgi:hypothetical protein
MSNRSDDLPQSAIRNPKSPLTDSPWFWVLLFSLMGLGALAAISGKYGQRQSRLERQYQARERIAEDTVGDPALREYSSPAGTLIPLWPLAVVLGGVAMTAGVMLMRERRGRGRPGSPQSESAPP